MNQETSRCDLCGLPVELPDFWLATKEGIRHFCCEGCLGIYKMLHEDEIIGSGQAEQTSQEEKQGEKSS